MGYGVLWALFATGTLQEPAGRFSGLGFWFIALALITASGAVASLAKSIGLFGLFADRVGFRRAGNQARPVVETSTEGGCVENEAAQPPSDGRRTSIAAGDTKRGCAGRTAARRTPASSSAALARKPCPVPTSESYPASVAL